MQRFAFLFGRIEPQREGQVIAGLEQIDRVDYAVQVLGKFDFIARVSIESSAGPSLETLKQVTEIQGLELSKILIAENRRYKDEKTNTNTDRGFMVKRVRKHRVC